MGQGGSKDSRSGSGMHQEQAIPITQVGDADAAAAGGGAVCSPVIYFRCRARLYQPLLLAAARLRSKFPSLGRYFVPSVLRRI